MFLFSHSLSGAIGQLPLQVVSQGIESVNGSDVNMGCARPVESIGGVTLCGSSGAGGGVISYLVDGNSPAIDTSTSDWASQLVTVRKNDPIPGGIEFDHVVLTFGFDTAVSLTSIELDLFLCPEWNIGAPYISVYGDERNSLVFSSSSDLLKNHDPSQTSCDSLSTVTISFQQLTTFPTWHIVVSFTTQPDIEWVHVGEVGFLGTDSTPASICPTVEPPIYTTKDSFLSLSEFHCYIHM